MKDLKNKDHKGYQTYRISYKDLSVILVSRLIARDNSTIMVSSLLNFSKGMCESFESSFFFKRFGVN